jgi:hypothetical protein
MDAPPPLVRLAIGGLLLDPRAYRAQRDDPAGLRRGALLVLLIGLALGAAALIGGLGVYLTQPSAQLLNETIYNGIVAMPWYREASGSAPELVALIDDFFLNQGGIALTPSPLISLLGLITTPLITLLAWLIGGSFLHLVVRAFGGAGRFAQTLATTALAASANLLGLVQLVPYAEQIPGSLLLASGLLGMLASYVAVRETHGLAPWRAFWAVLLGPLLLSVLLVALYCCAIFLFAGAAAGLSQGAAR